MIIKNIVLKSIKNNMETTKEALKRIHGFGESAKELAEALKPNDEFYEAEKPKIAADWFWDFKGLDMPTDLRRSSFGFIERADKVLRSVRKESNTTKQIQDLLTDELLLFSKSSCYKHIGLGISITSPTNIQISEKFNDASKNRVVAHITMKLKTKHTSKW